MGQVEAVGAVVVDLQAAVGDQGRGLFAAQLHRVETVCRAVDYEGGDVVGDDQLVGVDIGHFREPRRLEAGGYSIGLGIELPFEQSLNEWVDLGINFRYFFARKTMFVKCVVLLAELIEKAELVGINR